MDSYLDKLNNNHSETSNKKTGIFFKSVYETFLQAEKTTKRSIKYYYNIGGYVVCLRFAGSALVSRIAPALEHLALQKAATPSLTICLFDSASTKIHRSPIPWIKQGYFLRRGDMYDYNDMFIKTAIKLPFGALSMIDNELNLAIYWIHDAPRIPYYETGAPLLSIIHWWMNNHDRQIVHGGAVGMKDGGVLLAGRSGSGKSSAALSCLNSDLSYAGDDYVLLSKKSPFVYNLYNSAKLDPKHLQNFPQLLPYVSNSNKLDTEKALLFLSKSYLGKIATGFPIRAVLLPTVTGLKASGLTKVSSAVGAMALFPSTIAQLAGAGEEDFNFLTDFIERVPVYKLEMGTDLAMIPALILKLLSNG